MTSSAQNQPAGPYLWWHLPGLWTLVVAQPVLDVLRQNGDFFVAHRVTPLDLVLFVVVLTAVLPAVLGLAIRSLGFIWQPLARAVQLTVVGLLLAALASQIVVRLTILPTWPHVFVSTALGALGAWAYAESSALRWCASALVTAVPVFGGAFLLHPSMEPFVRPLDRTTRYAAEVPAGSAPIVMVVFDQLPLSSLLAPDGTIDSRHYPGFAALADTSTWYPNATANAEYTGWALPAILTGRMPRPEKLPIAQHHPQNLFSVAGESYRFEVTEPVTRLCPARLCTPDDGPMVGRLAGMLLDSSIVYAHIVSPLDLRTELPVLTDDWRDFVRTDSLQGRWVHARDRDRTAPVTSFLESISATDPQPTLYFLHVLLPHEPYVYLRSGQRFTTDGRLPGIVSERWGGDEYLVSLGYERHLTQLEFVDGVVSRLMGRLRAEKLFDDSLIVITSDHGASFRAGRPWKGFDSENAADIMGVPLFIKAPGQASGRTDTRNMQAIDVLPTLGGLLHLALREAVDGTSAVGAPPADTRKRLRYSGARREAIIETSAHERALMASVSRRWSTMVDGVRALPPGAPQDGLDAPVPAIEATSPLSVLLESPQRYRDVDLQAPVLPLYVGGRVLDADGRPTSAELALAVNGVVRGFARTQTAGIGTQDGAWVALLPARSLRPGRNLVQVYTVDPRDRDLELAFSSGSRPESLNLASTAAEQFWGVSIAGLGRHERGGGLVRRWTREEASLVIPLDVDPRPRSLRIGLAGPPAAGGPVRIRLNDCVLHDAPIDSSPWYRTFALDSCEALHGATEADVVIQSATVPGRDGSPRGVGVEIVNLLSEPWPPPPPGPGDLRARVTIAASGPTAVRADPLEVTIANTGPAVWTEAAFGAADRSSVALELQWRRGDTGPVDRTQRFRLPNVVYPGTSTKIDLPLVPPASVDGPGPWEVVLVPILLDGGALPADPLPKVQAVVASPTR